MSFPPPDPTTFGALVRFAITRETEAADRYDGWAADVARSEAFTVAAAEHRRRAEQLSRMVREQLNEMILEPISGLRAEDYAGPADSLALLESTLARLYTDMVAQAGHIFPGARRSLTRFAERSQQLARDLEGH